MWSIHVLLNVFLLTGFVEALLNNFGGEGGKLVESNCKFLNC